MDGKQRAGAVSVLIPVLNEADNLPETLARMRDQDYDGEIEFLFIDGGSEDGSRDFLERAAAEDPRVKLLDNPAKRTPQALNIGLAHSRSEFVARMDAHTFYPPNYLSDGIARLRRGDVDWVAGPAIAVGVNEGSRLVALALSSRLGTGGSSFRHATEEEFDAPTGFAGVWRRDVLVEHGGWDEDWPINQDSELAARMRSAGARIVCMPSMSADYIPRDSVERLWRQYFRYGQYRCKTAGRHPGSLRAANLIPPILTAVVVGALVGPGRSRRPLRLLLGLYLLLICGESARLSRQTGDAAAAFRLPPIFAAMHLAHGSGFFVGCFRFGPPVKAVVTVIRSLAARVLAR